MPLLQNASYAFSIATALDPYPDSAREIAFAGRSNAGKSSALNTLVAQRRLAFVSKTPGRTQMINFFGLGERRFLVDLPGYGYAQVPEKIRSQWDALLSTYLKHRDALQGLVLVMDIRQRFSDLDWRLIHYFHQTGKPIHVLLTKADKLSHAQGAAALAESREHLAKLSAAHSAQLFSSLKRTGVEEAESVCGRWLDITPRESKKDREAARARAARDRKPRKAVGAGSGTAGNKKPRAKGG
jgi:GTP-binding protein